MSVKIKREREPMISINIGNGSRQSNRSACDGGVIRGVFVKKKKKKNTSCVVSRSFVRCFGGVFQGV